MKKLIEYKHSANALYVRGILKENGISSQIREENNLHSIFISELEFENATLIVNELDMDETDIDSDSEGYLEGYKELIDNQYLEGYYSAGKIPRILIDKKSHKYFALYFALGGIFLIINLIFNDSETRFELLFYVLIYFTIGIIWFFIVRKRNKDK
jgi:hypothetical protein